MQAGCEQQEKQADGLRLGLVVGNLGLRHGDWVAPGELSWVDVWLESGKLTGWVKIVCWVYARSVRTVAIGSQEQREGPRRRQQEAGG